MDEAAAHLLVQERCIGVPADICSLALYIPGCRTDSHDVRLRLVITSRHIKRLVSNAQCMRQLGIGFREKRRAYPSRIWASGTEPRDNFDKSLSVRALGGSPKERRHRPYGGSQNYGAVSVRAAQSSTFQRLSHAALIFHPCLIIHAQASSAVFSFGADGKMTQMTSTQTSTESRMGMTK
jgi:hypothetical protein